MLTSLVRFSFFGSALINDVLDLSKIEAGRMEVESVPFNLRNEIDNVFSLFDEKIRQEQLEVSVLVHNAVPAIVIGDPGKLRQVLMLMHGSSHVARLRCIYCSTRN